MKKIYFIRSASYDYLIPDLDLYDSFNAVIKKEITPKFTETKDEFLSRLPQSLFNSTVVFSSPEKRCKITAGFIGRSKQIQELSEIEYVMENFISKKDFYIDDVPQVNQARKLFVYALINDTLNESYNSVIKRIILLENRLLNVEDKSIVCVSHGFLLRVIKSYFTDKTIVDKPRKLLKYFDGTKMSYVSGSGFCVEITNDKISVSYF